MAVTGPAVQAERRLEVSACPRILAAQPRELAEPAQRAGLLPGFTEPFELGQAAFEKFTGSRIMAVMERGAAEQEHRIGGGHRRSDVAEDVQARASPKRLRRSVRWRLA